MLHPHALPVDEGQKSYLSTARTKNLADGVFSIVMTLLVLELKIPDIKPGQLWGYLAASWPIYFSYVASFVMLGVFWVSHHILYTSIRFTDRLFLWLNLLFLLALSVIPFTTALLGQYWTVRYVPVLYGVHLAIIGFLAYAQWSYATTHHRLVDHRISPTLVSLVKRRILLTPIVCALAIGLSFFSASASIALYLLLPIYYIMPGKIDAFWSRDAEPHSHVH